jgi:catechol 2,3-dioxygenase-like lactoylglutathione lyase family enzyme
MADPLLVNRLTPVIFVDRVADCLAFWTERLGFQLVAEVPGPDGQSQFAMLLRDGVEVMYQTWASLEAESKAAAAAPRGHSISLFLEVGDIEAVDRAMAGVPRFTERHETFYGMDEFTVREAGGALVTFAMKVSGATG